MATSLNRTVGFLATGSEIVSGEILNTNGQNIAQSLQAKGVLLGQHVTVDDQEENLYQALNYLYQSHQIIIITGGLGPTSDDRTRFVVAKLINEALEFHQPTWDWIVHRFSERNIPITENNRQQALFPKSATVLPNENGSADACMIKHNQKWIFMLPGPPRECLPVFEKHVLPAIEAAGFTSDERLFRWRLLGTSESKMAEQLEPLAEKRNVTFAYRAGYPYLDIKVMLPNNETNKSIVNDIRALVSPYLVTTEHTNLSAQLRERLKSLNHKVWIDDQATKGSFISELLSPDNHHVLSSIQADTESTSLDFKVTLKGLENYWKPIPNQHLTKLTLVIENNNINKQFTCDLFLRGQETLNYVLEFSSHKILNEINGV
jgi:nicotinamide-nucleotide amidase